MMNVIWSEKAAETVRDIAAYIQREFGEQTKAKFLSEIDATVSVLVLNPKMGAKDPFLKDFSVELRSVRVNRLNRIVYYIDGQRIVIASFSDNRRDPKKFADDVELAD
ncbi:MAG: type II toxin-antitoxin system RelE/ParE family toxin [Bacteroidales bacterium]|nr:type II toxin-antitoxin system RelE/ParE family toxin [Bacteroidales bacterium]